MNILFKTFGVLIFVSLVLSGCQKTELAPISPAQNFGSIESRAYLLAVDSTTIDGGNAFTNKDKCKKCHAGKSLVIDWKAPYMANNNYKTIEELVSNYDFVNNVHLFSGKDPRPSAGISENEKQELIIYLKTLALKATQVINK